MAAAYPSFSKNISYSKLLYRRKKYDELLLQAKPKNKIGISQPLYDKIDEVTGQKFIYYDFYERISINPQSLSIFISPQKLSLHLDYNNYSPHFLQEYHNKYITIQKQLDYLGILATSNHLYSKTTLQAFTNLHKKITDDHRAWLRFDIAFFDITTGTMIPEHQVEEIKIQGKEYHIKCFIDSNKETVPCIIHNIYEIFGAVALLVHPKDKRYKKAIWKKEIILPLSNRTIPIVTYEEMNIEWYGTRLLVPWHKREDFYLAQQLGLSIETFWFDKFWKFTDSASWEFVNKSMIKFESNIVDYLRDITNLEAIYDQEISIYQDKKTHKRLYPILEKNVYIWLWYLDSKENSLRSEQSTTIWETENLEKELFEEEGFCITTRDAYYPIMEVDDETQLSTTLPESKKTYKDLIEDIVKDFYLLWLLYLPAKWNHIIDLFYLRYDDKFLWQLLYTTRTEETQYSEQEKCYDFFQEISENTPDDKLLNELLEIIDLGNNFIYTKSGYTLHKKWEYRYDNDYIAISSLIAQGESSVINVVINSSDNQFIKYFLYLHYYKYRKTLTTNIFSLEKKNVLHDAWDSLYTFSPDAIRIALLQAAHHAEHEPLQEEYSLAEIDHFLRKRRNLARIIPLRPEVSKLEEMIEILSSMIDQMSDYDKYLISTIHKLYEDVTFYLKKHQTDKAVYYVISQLWDRIIDILVYILKNKPSLVSEKVAAYVITFANNLLYPMAPHVTISLFEERGIKRYEHFFQQDSYFDVEQNIKCNFLIQFITTWYIELKTNPSITGFVLQANKDFIDYAKEILPDFYSFLGENYTITLLEEHKERPKHIVVNKVFAMQWWAIHQEKKETINYDTSIDELSLGNLNKQLAYNQQLLQSTKSNIARARNLQDKTLEEQFLNDKADLEKKIQNIQYEIAKLKYF